MKYDKIIDHPHHTSDHYPRMSIQSRAAQFASFKALTGFEDEIDETVRLTDRQYELTEEQQNELDKAINILEENASLHPLITVTYYVPDQKKAGGAYISAKGNFRIIDRGPMLIKFTDGREIPARDVVKIDL